MPTPHQRHVGRVSDQFPQPPAGDPHRGRDRGFGQHSAKRGRRAFGGHRGADQCAPWPWFFNHPLLCYNDSTYRNDITGTVVHTRARRRWTPRNLARAELAYDDKVFFGRIAANYMSKRYFTYTNAQYGLGYRRAHAV
jgi:hypothetical protein